MNNQLSLIDVKDIINILIDEILSLFKDEFVGFYIHGSLALGDFDINTSDIDFIIVTQNMVTKEQVKQLKEIHKRIGKGENRWGSRLEGSYVPISWLDIKEPPMEPRPYVSGNQITYEEYGYEWVLERYVIREYGITVEGPDPKTIMDAISLDDIRNASLNMFHHWWKPMIYDTSRLKDSEYQAYAVLTMCRILYMLSYGKMTSKKEAAKWAMNSLEKKWTTLIEEALKWEKAMDFDNVGKVREFIEFTLIYTNNNNMN